MEEIKKAFVAISYLGCSIDADHHYYSNPKMRDNIILTLELDSFGENTKKKRARYRMRMVDGSSNRYSKPLNSATRTEKYVDKNCLVSTLEELRLEKEE